MKQHLIDPEICIRCHTCEMTCSINAIENDGNNVVVNPDICNHCLECIPVCPTGSIDEWRIVSKPYSLEDQYSWEELPEQEENVGQDEDSIEKSNEALQGEDPITALLADAHKGAGGKVKAPKSASKPTMAMYGINNPVEAVVQGNFRLTHENSDSDVRHIILGFEGRPFPVLEGQNIGILAEGVDKNGKAHLPRLYSISNPRDGERTGYNNVSLTVKREENGVCSNYLCDAKIGDKIKVTGPFGTTFLMPEDPNARLLMICTGTGSAPMRAFTMRRQRTYGTKAGDMTIFFGARDPQSLPYFGPLNKLPDSLLKKHLVYSRIPGMGKEYVQDRMMVEQDAIADLLGDQNTHIYICGLRGMEEGVEKALTNIAESIGQPWRSLRDTMREEGRYHVETY